MLSKDDYYKLNNFFNDLSSSYEEMNAMKFALHQQEEKHKELEESFRAFIVSLSENKKE